MGSLLYAYDRRLGLMTMSESMVLMSETKARKIKPAKNSPPFIKIPRFLSDGQCLIQEISEGPIIKFNSTFCNKYQIFFQGLLLFCHSRSKSIKANQRTCHFCRHGRFWCLCRFVGLVQRDEFVGHFWLFLKIIVNEEEIGRNEEIKFE